MKKPMQRTIILKQRRLLLLLLLLCCLFLMVDSSRRKPPTSQGPNDHRGTTFLLSFLEMTKLQGSSRIFVTSSTSGNVTLYVPFLNRTETKPVGAGATTIFVLKPSVRMRGFGKQQKGMLLTSDVLVSVYATSEYGMSRDTYLVYPVVALGYEHVIATFTPRHKSQIGIIGAYDNTLIQIKLKFPKPTGNISYEGRTYHSGDILRVFLNRLESFQLQHDQDLTGSVLVATQPVAVLSGNMCARIPVSSGTCSHLSTQVPALSKWGRHHITVPMNKVKWHDVLRVVAAYDNTTVWVLGKTSFVLNASEYRQFQLGKDEPRGIHSSKPVMVVQFNQGSQGHIHSEPFMVTIPPTEQYTTSYNLVIPLEPQSLTYASYVDVVTETCTQHAIQLDSSLAGGSFTWRSAPGTNYSVGSRKLKTSLKAETTIPLSHGTNGHRFAALVFGHTDYDGYGYVGGMRMRDINCERLFPSGPQEGDRIDNDCDGTIDEETENSLDDDKDGKIDEDLMSVVTSTCNFDSVVSTINRTTSRTAYLSGAYFKYSAIIGKCENTLRATWNLVSPIGPAIELAVREIQWKKPELNVSFPGTINVDRHNVSTLDSLRPNITSSLCRLGNISVTYEDSGDVTKGGHFTRVWTVREACGRVISENQTIISTCFDKPSTESMSNVSIALGCSFGIVSFLLIILIILRTWKKHISRRQIMSVRIDVLEAAVEHSVVAWQYTNPTPIEDIVYAEISIEAPQDNNNDTDTKYKE